jgi:hypothetical protein
VARFRRAPAAVESLYAALRFRDPEMDGLARISEREGDELLAYAGRVHLTLALARCGAALPPAIERTLAGNLAASAARFERIRSAYLEIAGALEEAGLACAVLKGFAQAPDFTPDPRNRQQYDIDLYCPREAVFAARDQLEALGYQPVGGFERRPLDHLPTMVRPAEWTWRGDYFDPQIPLAVDLHFRFWSEATERLRPGGLDGFWERRAMRELEGLRFMALDPVDALAYTCLHALRHLLRGDLKAGHVYELAYFLDSRTQDAEFWREWRARQEVSLRALEAVCFRLAEEWFGCRMAPAAQAAVDELPRIIQRWFDEFALAPIESAFHPNKDEVWLHLALLESWRDRIAILRRRLIPLSAPAAVDASDISGRSKAPRVRARKYARHARFIGARALYHVRALAPALWSGFRFWLRSRARRSRMPAISF